MFLLFSLEKTTLTWKLLVRKTKRNVECILLEELKIYCRQVSLNY